MKKFVFALCAIFTCATVFAEKWNIYAGADETTLQAIEICNDHIANKRYQSAVNSVGSCNNEFLIYKYIEVCTQYFAQSIMHTMFAFKNLGENETLYDVRTKDNSFSLTFRDSPDDIIDAYIKEHGNSLVLELARANYYYDALNRYRNQWLKTPDEIIAYATDVYSRAIKEEVYDDMVVHNYADICLQNRNWAEAEKLFTMLTERAPTFGTYWYNLTLTKMYQEKYKDAIYPATMAVENPEDNPNYHLDAYLILADAYAYSNDFTSAEKTLLAAHEKYDYQPIVFQRLGELYITFSKNINIQKANDYMDKVLSVVCDDNTIYNCLNVYLQYLTPKEAINFCNRNISARSDKNEIALLTFFLGQIYAITGQSENAITEINNAIKLFESTQNTEMVNNCKNYLKQLQ